MKKQLVGFILPFLICVLMPLRATAEFVMLMFMSPNPWSYRLLLIITTPPLYID